MVTSMAAFLAVDVFIKFIGDDIPVGEILFVLGLGGCVFFGIWLLAQGESLFSRDFFSKVIIIRNLGEIVGTFGIVTSLLLIPLSDVSAIFQASPLLVATGAALFLNEPVGWRRWGAIIAGFVGVVIIVRPGGDGIHLGYLVALIGVTGQAVRDLATRAAPEKISSIKIGFYGVFTVMLLGISLMFFGKPPVMPSAQSAPMLLAIVVLGSGAYHFLNLAMRAGDVAVIVPFRYTRVIFGIAVGIALFSEIPDIWTYLGAGIIIAAGVYSFTRERKNHD